jgi:pimeloyl-ACP methyl ester carboxylesterase
VHDEPKINPSAGIPAQNSADSFLPLPLLFVPVSVHHVNLTNLQLPLCVLISMTATSSLAFFTFLVCFQILPRRTDDLLTRGGSCHSVSSQTQLTAPKIELPAPTGPFAVGTKIYDWVDHSRLEKATSNPRDFRQLIVQVWYPAEHGSGPTAAYVPMLESYRHVWDDTEVEVSRRVLTHSRLNEKPLSGTQFPIVLFSHGWQGTRSEYTSLFEDLASHGYAIFAIDHPYMGRVALPDGRVTESMEIQFHSSSEIRAYYAKDVKFAIDRISQLNAGDPEGTFTGKLALSRIAAIGHSSGFVAAGTACGIDRRITACVNVDAPGFSAKELAGIKQPLLWFRLEKAGPVPAEFLKTLSAPVHELRLMGAKHGSVEDWDYLEAESSAQRDAAAGLLQLIRKYLGAFLGEYLKDESSDLYRQNSANSTIAIKNYPSRETPAPAPKQ